MLTEKQVVRLPLEIDVDDSMAEGKDGFVSYGITDATGKLLFDIGLNKELAELIVVSVNYHNNLISLVRSFKIWIEEDLEITNYKRNDVRKTVASTLQSLGIK